MRYMHWQKAVKAMRDRLIIVSVLAAAIVQCHKLSPCYHVVLDFRTWLDIVRNDKRAVFDFDSIKDHSATAKPLICTIKKTEEDQSCESLLRKVPCGGKLARWDYQFEVILISSFLNKTISYCCIPVAWQKQEETESKRSLHWSRCRYL